MWHSLLNKRDMEIVANVDVEVLGDNILDRADLLSALEALEASDYQQDDEAITQYLKLMHSDDVPTEQQMIIARAVDAQAEIELRDGGLYAYLIITGAQGGKSVSVDSIKQALIEAQVTRGINKLALKKALIEGQILKAGQEIHQLVAAGKQPTTGEDAQFIPLVKDFSQRTLAPQQTECNIQKVDMRNLGGIVTVSAEDKLMKRIPATKGSVGFTVTGEELPALAGKDIPFKLYKHTQVSPQDPNTLIATASGLPKPQAHGVEISDILTLDGVSIQTGHVSFKGNIDIQGDVESGMIVKSTGNVTVSGFVEGATIQAQGDITVKKGVIGHTASDEAEEVVCHLIAKGNIRAEYALNAYLTSSKSINLNLHSINSELTANKNVIVLNRLKNKGMINGGKVSVGGFIRCHQLGAEGDSQAHLYLFKAYPQYYEKLEEAKQAYTEAQEATMDIIRKELELKKIPKSQRTPEQVRGLETERTKRQAQLEKAKNNKEHIEKEIDKRMRNSTVEVLSRVYTHISIHYGDVTITTRKEYGYSFFSCNKYEITRADIKPNNFPLP